jgi:hypothetical protein
MSPREPRRVGCNASKQTIGVLPVSRGEVSARTAAIGRLLASTFASLLMVLVALYDSKLGIPLAPAVQVLAQDATPGVPTTTDILVECGVAPRPLDAFAALESAPPGFLAQASQAVGTPRARTVPELDGMPADQSVVDAVVLTIEELTACGNDGDLLRMTALMTDDYLRRSFGGLPKQTLAAMATPTPVEEGHRSIVMSVEDVRLLPDGRIAATMRTNQSTSLVVFKESEGRYLLDDNYELSLAGTPTP